MNIEQLKNALLTNIEAEKANAIAAKGRAEAYEAVLGELNKVEEEAPEEEATESPKVSA